MRSRHRLGTRYDLPIESTATGLHDAIPLRQVRAAFDELTIVVYQAYGSAIAVPALAAKTFVAPFKFERMTWIKPSFRWMMYRSGWATKPGQERVLAVTITRQGFEWALAHACLTHFDASVYPDTEAWETRKAITPVRVQWDPERTLRFDPLDHRAIQVGLGDEAVRRYLDDWIVDIADVTPLAHEIHALVSKDDLDGAAALLPAETPYPLADEVRAALGAD